MKDICRQTFLFLGLCLSARAAAQADVTLLLKTDVDCNWKLDGQNMDPLKAHDQKVVPVSPGEHRIWAITTDGVTKIRIEAVVDQGQKIVEIQLKDEHEQELKREKVEAIRRQAEAEAALHPTWTDPATGLMWAKKDNGSDVDWPQANDYCSKLQLAGYKDWRLPTIEELQGIYDPSVSLQAMWDAGVAYVHVKGNLKLSGWIWSSSQGGYPGFASVFAFAHEEPGGGFPRDGFSYSSRALCVRPSGEWRGSLFLSLHEFRMYHRQLVSYHPVTIQRTRRVWNPKSSALEDRGRRDPSTRLRAGSGAPGTGANAWRFRR